MEIQTTAAYTECHVRLFMGKDFTEEQLEPDLIFGGELKLLTAEARRRIATEQGYDECVWSGHYHEDDGTVQITLRKGFQGKTAPQQVKGEFIRMVYLGGVPFRVGIDQGCKSQSIRCKSPVPTPTEEDAQKTFTLTHHDMVCMFMKLKRLDELDYAITCHEPYEDIREAGKMARTRITATPALKSWEDVDAALRAIAEERIELGDILADLNRQMIGAKAVAELESKPHADHIFKLERDIQEFVAEHRDIMV